MKDLRKMKCKFGWRLPAEREVTIDKMKTSQEK